MKFLYIQKAIKLFHKKKKKKHLDYIYIYIYIPWRDFSQAINVSSVNKKLEPNQKTKCILSQATSKYTKKLQIHLKKVPNSY